MSWSILEFVNNFNKPEKKKGVKASSFFTLKTSEEVKKEEYEESQYQKYLENTDIDHVLEKTVDLERKIIARVSQCKSLIKKDFLDGYMAAEHREMKVISQLARHLSFRVGYLSVTGHTIAMEIGCHYFDQFYINFASLHNSLGNMKQEIGPLKYNEIISTPYPEWFVSAIRNGNQS
jgi:hypothetical protein